jgi:hypothetical protein
MPTLSSGLLRTGLALKLSQIKLATRSYLRDRTGQATSTVTAYAIAAGLFAAAGYLFDSRLSCGRHGFVSLDRNQLRAVSGFRSRRRIAAGGCCDLRGLGRKFS